MTLNSLVSIIIPCFNAAKWIDKTIEACLNQIYENIEIIVVDDGSTDNSIDIVRKYDDKIILESGPNRGGCYARNRGFSISKGDYIQFLDADDIILPEKIYCQIQHLQATESDVVYGDWRYLYNFSDGSDRMSEIEISGAQPDMVEYFLRDEHWITPSAYLFKRSVVINSGGWDEQLFAGQDRDFVLSVALSGASFSYLPECHSIYRRHGSDTVSTRSQKKWLESHFYLMKKAENKLVKSENFNSKYKQALASSYFNKAISWCLFLDMDNYIEILKHTQFLDDQLMVKPSIFRVLEFLFGFLAAATIFRTLKQARYLGKARQYNPFKTV